jgi:hypothetical protein
MHKKGLKFLEKIQKRKNSTFEPTTTVNNYNFPSFT